MQPFRGTLKLSKVSTEIFKNFQYGAVPTVPSHQDSYVIFKSKKVISYVKKLQLRSSLSKQGWLAILLSVLSATTVNQKGHFFEF